MSIKSNEPSKIPEPVEGVDYYTDVLKRHTVSIEVIEDGFSGESDEEICTRAIQKFRDKEKDGNSEIMSSVKIMDVERECNSGFPFNHDAWQKNKLMEIGLNKNEEPL